MALGRLGRAERDFCNETKNFAGPQSLKRFKNLSVLEQINNFKEEPLKTPWSVHDFEPRPSHTWHFGSFALGFLHTNPKHNVDSAGRNQCRPKLLSFAQL